MKYGVMLTDYGGQIFDIWAWDDKTNEEFQTENVTEASAYANELKTKNPKGRYLVKEFKKT